VKPEGALLLRRQEVASLLSLDECITAAEQAFRVHVEGRTLQPGVLGLNASDRGFHIKAAGRKLGHIYFAAKVKGNFFHNMDRYGMPNIQGIILLCDGKNGYPLVLIFDSTGTALQEVAAAALVYGKAMGAENYPSLNFAM
jgi:ornithine cyclodeaminase/alanine dehydrogenase-like protein (mu-crystallin family)